MCQVVVDTFNQKIDSAQHRQNWEGTVTDVLGVICGMNLRRQILFPWQLDLQLYDQDFLLY